MQVIVDVTAWMQLNFLVKEKRFDLRPFLDKYDWIITPQIQSELKEYQLESFLPTLGEHRIDISDEEIQQEIKSFELEENIDWADFSCLILAKKQEAVILTDDGALFLYALYLKIPVIRLPHFLLKLVRDGILPRTDMSWILRFWENRQFYSKKEISRYQFTK